MQDDAEFFSLLAVDAVVAERVASPSFETPASGDHRIDRATTELTGATSAVVFTDGGCDPNPGTGGWGVVIESADSAPVELWGGVKDTTNNRMELTAAIVALTVLPTACAITIKSDSQYLIKGMTIWLAGWKRKLYRRKDGLIPNHDLWRTLNTLSIGRQIEWEWVRGHSGAVGNERADGLAARGITEARSQGVRYRAMLAAAPGASQQDSTP